MTNKTLLLAEDDPILLDALAEVLEMEDFTVLRADNGAKALQLALETPVDLVITDIVMPQMDGYQLFARLRENPVTAHVPVIFLTSLIDDSDVQKGVALGVDAYITKPFTNVVLITMVRLLLPPPTGK